MTPNQRTDISEAKAALRASIRAGRKQLLQTNPDERQARDKRIQGHLLAALEDAVPPGSTITAFVPMPGEPGGANLPTSLRDAGYQVILPFVVPNPDPTIRELEWRTYAGTESLVANSMGILEPTGPSVGELADAADLIVLPALAIGSDGVRLGQGGGYYDRQLQCAHSRIKDVWAILDSSEVHRNVPAESHDLSVSAAITAEGFVAFG